MYVLPLLFDKSDVSIKDLRLTIVYHLTKIFSVQIFTENNFTKRHNTENFSSQKSTFLYRCLIKVIFREHLHFIIALSFSKNYTKNFTEF